MSPNTISLEDAALLIHRFITERVHVLALYVSSGRSVTAKILGFVTGFTREVGMAISTEWPKPESSLPAFMIFSHEAIMSSKFTYSDDTQIPAESELGSGLRIELTNGDTLTIAEIRRHE